MRTISLVFTTAIAVCVTAPAFAQRLPTDAQCHDMARQRGSGETAGSRAHETFIRDCVAGKVPMAEVPPVPESVRGLRAVSDYEAGLRMAHRNHRLAPEIDTVFCMTALEYGYLSSSLVREIVRFGGDPSGMVPPSVADRLVAVAAAEETPFRVR